MFSFLRNALDKTRLSVSSFRDVWTADNSAGLMTFQPAYFILEQRHFVANVLLG